MAAGDIIIPGNTITPEILDQIASEVQNRLASTSKDPGQYEEVNSLTGITSIPVFQQSGADYKLVRVLVSLLKGNAGATPDITFRVNTLPYGTAPSVDKTGTAEAPIITIGLPSGKNGEKIIPVRTANGINYKYEGQADSEAQLLFSFAEVMPDVSDFSEAGIKLLQQPATDAATEVRQQMDGITLEATQLITTTTEAKDAAIRATEKAQSVSDHPGYIGEDYHVYTWDYATGAYNKTDTVLRPEGFSIFRTYESIAAMNADKANVPEGKFVLINTGSVEDPDTARLYVKGPADFDFLVDMSGAIGFTGKTPQITIGTVTVGGQASATLSPDGTDDAGNPRFKLNLVIVAGPQGLMPVIELGTVSTGQPGTNASATFEQNGQTADGRDKYLLNLTIPQGIPGTGSGNVFVDASGIMAGKKYLFVPNADGSPVGAFVEYAEPAVATAEKAGLMSPEQVQKLENLSTGGNIITIPNAILGLTSESTSEEIFAAFGGANKLAEIAEKSVLGKYILRMGSDGSYYVIALTEVSFTDANNYNIGLSFSFSNIVSYFDINVTQGIATANPSIAVFPVMESGTLDDGYYVNNVERGNFANQKSLSIALTELRILDIAPLINAANNNTVLSDSDYQKVVDAYNNKIGIFSLDEKVYTGSFTPNTTYLIINACEVLSYSLSIGIQISVHTFRVHKITKEVEHVGIGHLIQTGGDGTKALMDDGVYAEVVKDPNYVHTDNNYTTEEKNKLSGIAANANNYSLPAATDSALGGIKTGYSTNAKNYPVKLDANKNAYVNVPWTDTDTTYSPATQSANGLMSAADKKKLDRIGSYTTATTVASLNANYEKIEISNLSANASLSVNLTGTAYNGWEILVAIYCSSARTITIPTTGNYISMIGSSLTCPAGKWTELHLVCIGGKWRIAKLEQE